MGRSQKSKSQRMQLNYFQKGFIHQGSTEVILSSSLLKILIYFCLIFQQFIQKLQALTPFRYKYAPFIFFQLQSHCSFIQSLFIPQISYIKHHFLLLNNLPQPLKQHLLREKRILKPEQPQRLIWKQTQKVLHRELQQCHQVLHKQQIQYINLLEYASIGLDVHCFKFDQAKLYVNWYQSQPSGIQYMILTLFELSMQDRIYNSKKSEMNEGRLTSEYSNIVTNKRKKIEITSSNKVDLFKKQQYHESNPYFLNRNPSNPYLQKTSTTPESFSNRDTLTQTSSQKSGKIIRTNGLSKAEKPNIGNSRIMQNRVIVHKMSGSRIGPAFSSGYNQQLYTMGQSPNPYGMSNNKHGHSPIGKDYGNKLIQENSILKQQNVRLKQQMGKMQRKHSQQINVLKQQFERVFKTVGELEQKIKQQQKQWEKYQKQPTFK